MIYPVIHVIIEYKFLVYKLTTFAFSSWCNEDGGWRLLKEDHSVGLEERAERRENMV